MVSFLKKSILFFLLILLSFNSVHAQDIEKQPRNRICIKPIQELREGGGYTEIPPSDKPLTIVINKEGLPPNKLIDIELCQPSAKKSICKYILQLMSDEKGKIFGVYSQIFSGHVPYSVYASWPIEPTPTPAVDKVGGVGGEQQGALIFEKNDSSKEANCTSIEWDPFGRIFDAKTLEPIPNVSIALLDSFIPEKYSETVNNPQSVKEDGVFNFVVKEGNYYLLPIELNTPYSFVSNPHLHKNYAKAYSKKDGTNSIYYPGVPIYEKEGFPEHRDIPLDPGDLPGKRYPLINMPGQFQHMLVNDDVKYAGMISHPLSKVTLIGKDSQKIIDYTQADKFGYWQIILSNDEVPQQESLLIQLTKVDLTTLKESSLSAVLTHDVEFNPIPKQLSGFLYDPYKKILPLTKITLKRESDLKTVNSVTTNKDGFFSFNGQILPHTPFDMYYQVLGDNKEIKKTISEFSKENRKFLEKNKINLMVSSSKENYISKTRETSQDKTSLGNPLPTQGKNISNQSSSMRSIPFILIVIIILTLIGAVILVLLILQIKKEASH